MMKKNLIFACLAVGLTLMIGCGNRSKMADYERKIDSIRKAENMQTLLPKTDNREPLEVFFDTLSMIALPLRYSDEFVTYLPQMARVPKVFNSRMGCEGDQDLQAALLPPTPHYRVALVAERLDSLASPTIYLCVFSQDYVLQDRLSIYERNVGDLNGDVGSMKLEYSVTSRYEVTLMRFFRSDSRPDAGYVWKETRRFHINHDGNFEEDAVDL